MPDRPESFIDRMAAAYRSVSTDPNYNDIFDFAADGDVDALDLLEFSKRYRNELPPTP